MKIKRLRIVTRKIINNQIELSSGLKIKKIKKIIIFDDD